jgi:hypothetical protein
MAGSFGDYTENKVLELLVGKTAFSTPTCYVAASTADPTDDGSGIAEPSGNGYARVSTAGGDWEAAASGAIQNANAISFPTASGSWGTITHFALYDASTNGNMLAHGDLDSSQAISTNQTLRFDAGALDITLA